MIRKGAAHRENLVIMSLGRLMTDYGHVKRTYQNMFVTVSDRPSYVVRLNSNFSCKTKFGLKARQIYGYIRISLDLLTALCPCTEHFLDLATN